ncbi:hypothetical protein D3C85_1454310 [compost metagenome]
MNAFTGQCVQVCRQRCGQGFTFTGTHFCDAAFVQNHTAEQLYVKVTHAEHAFTRFTNHGESFRNQAFQGCAFCQALTEFTGFRFQFVIGEFFHLRFHTINDGDRFAHTAQGTIVTATENFG